MKVAVRIAALFAVGIAFASAAACVPIGSRSSRVVQPLAIGAIEDTATRASFQAYFREHVSDIKRPLLIQYGDGAIMTTAQAAASQLSSPTLVWLYDPSRVTSLAPDAWRGLVPPPQHEYVFEVVTSGTPVFTMKIWDMPHFWVPFVVRYRPLESLARKQLNRYFGSSDYEFAYVEQGGVWGLGRHDGRVAGILIEPWGESHRTGTPYGVQTGAQLDWWLAHPIGP